MRKFWAHVVIALGGIAMVGGAFVPTMMNAKTNNEYTQGREITFRITPKDGQTYSDDLAKIAAQEMDMRLKNASISQYEITTKSDKITDGFEKDSNYFVTVKLACQTETDYGYTVDYLKAFGNMALTNKSLKADSEPLMLKDIRTGDAYVETVESVNPVIKLPIDLTYKSGGSTILELKEKTLADDANAEVTKEEGSETEVKTFYFYLWYDFVDGRDSYSKTISTDTENYDSNVAARLSNIKYDLSKVTDDSETLDLYVTVDTNGDGTASAEEVKSAFKQADSYARIFNAKALDYEIQCIGNSLTYLAPATVESLFNFSNVQTLAFSKTLIGLLASIVIISLLLSAFYKVGALSVAASTLVSVFGGLGLIIAFGAEFTTAGVIGLILVALGSLASGVVYLTKLKEDCYKGHTLKKANAEASKKSLLPIIDINVVIIIVGIFTYIFGGIIARTFAVATVMGGLISLIANTIGLKGLMYLATNSTGVVGKYEWFGVDRENVPNHSEDEKQTFFGPFQDKDLTKKKKPVSIVLGSLSAVSIVAMIVFGCLTKGFLFNTGNKALNNTAGTITNTTQIFVKETKDSSDAEYKLTDDILNTVVSNIRVYEEGKEVEKMTKFSSLVKDYKENSVPYTTYEFQTKEDNITEKMETEYHKYTVITLTKAIDATNLDVIYEDKVESKGKLDSVWEDALSEQLGYFSPIYSSFKTVDTLVSQNQIQWQGLFIGTVVSTAVIALYFCLRYKLSRGLASLLFPLASCSIAVGFFSLLRIVTPNYALISLPVIAAFTFIISAIFMNKEREMILDDKSRDVSVGKRNEIMNKANSLAYMPIIVVTVFAVSMLVLFFGFGPKATAIYYLMGLIGIAVGTLAVTTLLGPLSQVFYKSFSKIKIQPKEKKKKDKVAHKSNEPEEAIFFGIND